MSIYLGVLGVTIKNQESKNVLWGMGKECFLGQKWDTGDTKGQWEERGGLMGVEESVQSRREKEEGK